MTNINPEVNHDDDDEKGGRVGRVDLRPETKSQFACLQSPVHSTVSSPSLQSPVCSSVYFFVARASFCTLMLTVRNT